MSLPQEIIRLTRDKKTLPPDFIHEFVSGIVDGQVSDAQISALCMAILLNGFSFTETAALTKAMAKSGVTLEWGDIAHMIVDKHSTGGVGDKISLMLAPMVAACGLYVPMIAGRGLGHTGGTIDKLESIPGFKTTLPLDQFQQIVRKWGCAIIGQTDQLAPADKRIYAVRDVTGTVESVELITASILSKKLAAGLHGLVLDVKCGNGAFMSDINKAVELANSLKNVAKEAGLILTPVITDMNQILGTSAGNAVEVIEAVHYLTGVYREPRMHELTVTLASHMLVLGHKTDNLDDARKMVLENLENGNAAESFINMVTAQGGPSSILKDPHLTLGAAPIIKEVIAEKDGFISGMDTRDIGVLLVKLKAGRALVGDAIDPLVGITDIAPIGTKCEAGKTVLARLHLRHDHTIDFAHLAYLKALHFSDTMPDVPQIVLQTL